VTLFSVNDLAAYGTGLILGTACRGAGSVSRRVGDPRFKMIAGEAVSALLTALFASRRDADEPFAKTVTLRVGISIGIALTAMASMSRMTALRAGRRGYC